MENALSLSIISFCRSSCRGIQREIRPAQQDVHIIRSTRKHILFEFMERYCLSPEASTRTYTLAARLGTHISGYVHINHVLWYVLSRVIKPSSRSVARETTASRTAEEPAGNRPCFPSNHTANNVPLELPNLPDSHRASVLTQAQSTSLPCSRCGATPYYYRLR